MNLSDNSPANLTRCFSTILRDGPEAGIHTLAWCDTFSNVKRELENGMWHEFDTRIVCKMPSSEDSDALVESPAATSLEQYRALLFRGGDGTLEKFIPYDLPLSDLSFTNWFHQVIDFICRKN